MAATIQTIEKPTRYRALDTSTSEQIVGNQLLEDPSFDVNVSGGATGAHWLCDVDGNDGVSITGGKAVWASGGSDIQRRLQDNTDGPFSDVTARYRVTIVISDYTAGGIRFVTGSYLTSYLTAAGTYVFDMSPKTGGGNFHLDGNADADLSVSEVSAYKLESFSNNNHAQIYSGRALEFDGVSDNLTLGSDLTISTSAWTVAVWAYVVNYPASTNMVLFGNSDSTNSLLSQYVGIGTTGKLVVYDGSYESSNTSLKKNIWKRVVYSYDGSGNITFYQNGVADGTFTVSTSVDHLKVQTIGSLTNQGRMWDGKLSDMQFWDAAFSADDAMYDYLNPEQLALNRGGSSLTNSNLKLWFPMNEGHRGNQSYVLDASNTGLGPELITNGDFSDNSVTTTSGGSALAGWTSEGTHDSNHYWELTNGQCRLVTNDGTATSITQTILTSGVTYRYSITVNTSADGRIKLQHGTSQIVITDAGETGTFTGYFTANHANFKVVRGDDGGANDVTFDNISIKAVNDKNNATTVFYGDELITDTENRDFSSSSNWTNRAMGTAWTTYDESASSGATEGDYFTDNYLHLAVTSDASNNKGAYLDGAEFETGMVPGRTYRLSYSMHITAYTSGTLSVGLASASHSMSTSAVSYTSTQSAGTYNLDFVYDGTTNHAEIMINASTSSAFTVYFDNFSLKEVGTATGWTDSDQQLDIPQTALQSYNQLAWFDGAADYVSIADHNDFSFGDGTNDSAFSLSSWIFVNEATHFPIMGKNSSSHREWLLYIDQNDKLAMLLLDNSSGANQGRYYNATWPHTGKWAHVSATYDGNEADADAGLKLYVNGERVDDYNTTSGSYTAMENKDGVVTIGASLNGANYADGAITESCIWNKELSQAEITELYNDGLALDATTHSASSNLIGYWRNNGLATWQDLTANDRDGTPTSVTETMLITAGVDSSRDSQGFLMNSQRTTNSLNLPQLGMTASGADIAGSSKIEVLDTAIIADYGASDWSVECWFKAEVSGEPMFMVTHQEAGNDGEGWHIRWSSSNTIYFVVSDHDKDDMVIEVANALAVEEWHHIICSYDYSANKKIVYINGVLRQVQIDTDVGTVAPVANIHIGTRRAEGSQDWVGQIDDFKIYNKLLSDGGAAAAVGSNNNSLSTAVTGEVLRNYNAGKRSHR